MTSALHSAFAVLACATVVWLASGCTNAAAEGDGSGDTELAATSEAALAPAADKSRIEVGPLLDEELRQIIYQGLDVRLGKTQAIGENVDETTEIGDYDAFRFAVLKLTRGADDVSGDRTASPDGMDVEVTGWFKRTVTGDGNDTAACTSFDARVTLLKRDGGWVFSDENPVTFGREDPEDCY